MSTNPHITSLLGILEDILAGTSRSARDAHLAMQTGEQDRAMGSLLSLDEQLTNAQAIYETVQSLHRRGPS